MAKKAKKTAPKKKAKVVKRPKARTRKPGPRSQALPGMEQVRHQALDHLCESISENRRNINDLKADEKSLEQQALKEMRTRDTTLYRHAGVDLVRVAGDERLMVRTSKVAATSDAAPEAEEGEDGGEE